MIKIETIQLEDGGVDVQMNFDGSLLDLYYDTVAVVQALGEELNEHLPDYGKSALIVALAKLEKKEAET